MGEYEDGGGELCNYDEHELVDRPAIGFFHYGFEVESENAEFLETGVDQKDLVEGIG